MSAQTQKIATPTGTTVIISDLGVPTGAPPLQLQVTTGNQPVPVRSSTLVRLAPWGRRSQ